MISMCAGAAFFAFADYITWIIKQPEAGVGGEYKFWTDVFTVPVTLSMEHTIDHQDVTVMVEGDYNGNIEARTGVPVYLFTAAGTYMSQSQTTDGEGRVTFNLPAQDYKVRADYMTKQYWSSDFNWTDETITITDGLAEVHVTMGASPLENVPVYVFNDLGAYLNINDLTDENGVVSFRLPEGTYKFRADHLSSQYWATEPVSAHQINVINVDTGGGTFTFTVEKAAGMPLVDVPVYVFTSGGAYLGLTAHTDAQGQAEFTLSDGNYNFRVDYLGYQFWSGVSTVPTTLSDVLTVSHQDVTITVERLYEAPAEALEGVKVYLFKESGAYLGQNATNNSQGDVVFSLPEQSYKIRADYLGYQFWSDPFTWVDTTVTIDHGMAVLHVAQGGSDAVGAAVYLFKASGSYLGKSETTDGSGVAQFLLPDQQYKFRVDHGGSQYWSDVVTMIPYEENHVELNLDLLALDLTNDPNPVRYHGMAPVLEPEKSVVALLSALPGLWVDTAYAQGATEKLYFFINDHLGAPQKVVDEAGVVVWDGDYWPFGNVDVNVGTYGNKFRFAGQYYDQETGLHYNYHRYYDPGSGRYLRTDPIGLSGGINPYLYSEANPINHIDPLGLDTWSGAGDEVGGFLVFAGTSTMYGFVTNWDTGEKCYVETRCYKLGVGLAGGVTAQSIWIPNGPKLGKDLEGSSIGMGIEGGLGGYISGSPAGTATTSETGTTGLTGGAGLGAGFAEYSQKCTTRVISCENTPEQCSGN